jgi:single-stranded-DNA-specific exonuclease
VLWHRGLRTQEAVASFLDPQPGPLRDPFLLPQMDRAVHRILRALLGGEGIGVFGDFDADGVTATALLTEALEGLGGRVVPYIPHRVTEGHGLNVPALRYLRQQGVGLVITVDTGIAAGEEGAAASSLNMDLIVTDHHLPSKTPPQAVAVISPWVKGSSYPFPHLTGAGLALKVAEALYRALRRPLPPGLVELAALGTIADLGPLRGENRSLVREGLRHLRCTRRPGLLALYACAGLRPEEVSAETVAFIVAPRLNAPGRLASAEVSLRLLLAPSPEEAIPLAREAEEWNAKRQRLTEELTARAMERVPFPLPPLLFVGGEEFVPGVNGLVAARLVEAFYRPAVVAASCEGRVRASARSIPEVDISRALEAASPWLERFGGHAAAGGFECSPAALPAVQEAMAEAIRQQVGATPLAPTLTIDGEASFADMVGIAYQTLRQMEPFGPGNPEPLFLARGVEVLSWRVSGEGGEHLLLRFRQGKAVWDGVGFRLGATGGQGVPPRCDVVFTPDLTCGENPRGLRLIVRDLRPAGGAGES